MTYSLSQALRCSSMFLLVMALGCAAGPKPAALTQSGSIAPKRQSTLSASTLRLLQRLPAPVVVEAYFVRGLPRQEQAPRVLRSALEEYQTNAAGRIQFEIIETGSATDSIRERAEAAGLHAYPFADDSNGVTEVVNGYYGISFIYKGARTTVPLSGPVRRGELEYLITNEIRTVYDTAEKVSRRVGVIEGKGELKLTDPDLLGSPGSQGLPSLQKVLKDSFPIYSLESVDLGGGDRAIDPTLAGLIVTQPGATYSESELRRIDEFLMRGNKALAVFASAVSLQHHDSRMSATLDLHGLDHLLDGYGIHMQRDAVLDFGNPWSVQIMVADGLRELRYPGIAVVHEANTTQGSSWLDDEFGVFARQGEIAFPFASSLVVLPGVQPSTTRVQVVARSSRDSVLVTNGSVELAPLQPWDAKGKASERAIAAVAKGPLRSAFAGEAASTALGPSRVIVVSSSLFLANPFVFCGGNSRYAGASEVRPGDPTLFRLADVYARQYLVVNVVAVKRILDWMTADADLDDGLN